MGRGGGGGGVKEREDGTVATGGCFDHTSLCTLDFSMEWPGRGTDTYRTNDQETKNFTRGTPAVLA